jgi:regulatory protein
VEELDASTARQAALKMLARREHSRGELEDKLIRKGCGASLAAVVAAALAAEQLLSDERFVEMLVRARRRRGYGPLRIQQELKDKQIASELIGRWLDKSGRGWIEDLKRARNKRFGSRLPGSIAERAKQARFLQQRGFTFEQINMVLNPRRRD